MNGSVNIFKSDGLKKKGYPIKITLRHEKVVKRKTIAYSSPDDWNEKTKLPRISHFDYDNLYVDIIEIRKKLISRTFQNEFNFERAFNYLLDNENKKEKENYSFYDFAENRIKYLKSIEKLGNAKVYQTCLNELRKYTNELYFSDIDKTFIYKFIDFKKSLLYPLLDPKTNKRHPKAGERITSNNSIRNYIRTFKALFNRGLIEYRLEERNPFTNCFKELPVSKRPNNVYLSYDSLKKLKDVNLDQISYQRSIDLALLQFYLAGINLIDLYYLKWDQIKKDRLYFNRSKMAEKGYMRDIKIFDCAWTIIDKYSDKKTEYVFDWEKDRTRYETFRGNYGRDINKAFNLLEIKTEPLNKKFGTMSPRHTFQTLGKFKMINTDLLRELVGHERQDVDTVYKDVFPEEMRDNAHFDIINLNNSKNL